MAISREKKEQQVAALTDRFKRFQAAVVTHYHGLTVREMQELRNTLGQQELDFEVAKLTLFHRAAKAAGIKLAELEGPVGIAFGYHDPVSVAKAIHAFSKEHEAMEIVGGIVDGKVVEVAVIQKLAALPSREELLGRLVGSIASGPRNLVSALAGASRNLVYALSAVKEAKS